MKYLKTFEEKSIAVILYSKDKIMVKDYNDEIVFFINGAKRSLASGIFMLLNTEYEEDPNLRDIQIKIKPKGPALNNNATRKTVLEIINKKYNLKFNTKDKLYKLINFRKMFAQSNTIGELFDNARKTIIDEILFHLEIQKYNL